MEDKTVDAEVAQLVTETMAKMTHNQNCVMVTIGGNKVGWTSAQGRVFRFTFFDDGVVEGSGTWANVIGDEMGDYGITARKGAGAVLGSLEKKGLLVRNGEPDETEGNWWSLTALGAKVALALNEKDWSSKKAPKVAPVEAPKVEAPKAPKAPRASRGERRNRAAAALTALEAAHSTK